VGSEQGERVSIDYLDLPQLLAARGTVRLPGSKSLSNRVLLLAALASRQDRALRPAALRRYRAHARSTAHTRRWRRSGGGQGALHYGRGGGFPGACGRSVSRQRRHGFPTADRSPGAGRRQLPPGRRAADARTTDWRSGRCPASARRRDPLPRCGRLSAPGDSPAEALLAAWCRCVATCRASFSPVC
jgi:hypothetical protein